MANRRGASKWLRMLAPMLVSIGGLTMLRLLGPDFLDQQKLHELLVPLGDAAPAVFVLCLAVRPVLLLPGQLFTAVGGMLFGTLAATLYSLLGSFIAAALLFWVARRLGTRPMKRLAGVRYDALSRVARRHDFKFSLLVCINPLFPTDVMIAAAAAAGARFWPTVLGVMLGSIPGTFLTAQFGSGLAQGRTVLTAVSAAGLVLSLGLGALLGRRIARELNAEAASDTPPPDPVKEARRPRRAGLLTRTRRGSFAQS
ncbi:VTT domain-containing protein [Myxococcaceae bacterium GXIMD 01537]